MCRHAGVMKTFSTNSNLICMLKLMLYMDSNYIAPVLTFVIHCTTSSYTMSIVSITSTQYLALVVVL